MRAFSAFVGDEYLGQGYCDAALSWHYLCPFCGSIWARVISDAPTSHGALHIPCPEHAHEHHAPSIIFQEWRFYRARWPRDVFVHDFLSLMTERERFIHNNLPGLSHDQHQAA